MPTDQEPVLYTVTGHASVPVEVAITVYAATEIQAVRNAEKLFKAAPKGYVASGKPVDEKHIEWRWLKVSKT